MESPKDTTTVVAQLNASEQPKVPATAPPLRALAKSSILLLDDDPNFRQLVAELFALHGYEVWHARSADEATSYLRVAQPSLAIVDYRLPGTDGVTWIKRARERGFEFPIILCTGSWIDAKTFNWLRNMLHVSLVIQKPIVPELFLSSVDAILPLPRADSSPIGIVSNQGLNKESAGGASEKKTVGDPHYVLTPTMDSDQTIPQLEKALNEESDQTKVRELQGLLRRVKTQQAINLARQQFVSSLPEEWSSLVSLAKRSDRKGNRAVCQQLRESAHKLKGSTGSYGFSDLSKLFERLEDFSASIDPSDTMQGLLWSEIDRCIASGEDLVEEVTRHQKVDIETSVPQLSLLAVLCDDCTTQEDLRSLGSGLPWLHIDFANSAAGAEIKCKSHNFDAVIIDTALDANRDFQTSRLIRSISGYNRIPIAFLETREVPAGKLIYAGGSLVIRRESKPADLESGLKQLNAIVALQKQRVLCVDDDPQLTSFIEAVLTAEGLSVRSLHEPIRTLETAEEFHPQLVLLDIMMPGLSGFDVCRTLKAKKEWVDTPVLFLTAKYDARSRACAFQAGGDDFLAKPIVKEELVARVMAHLAKTSGSAKGPTLLLSETEFLRAADLRLQQLTKIRAGGTMLVLALENVASLDLEHGPFASEIVATTVRQLISVRFRPEDIRAQLCRDRVAVFIAGVTATELEQLVQTMDTDLSSLWFGGHHGGTFQPHFRIGVAESGLDGDSARELLDTCITRVRSC